MSPTPDPDLERGGGDGALKVPANPFAPTSPSLQPGSPPAVNSPPHNRRRISLPNGGTKPSPRSPSRKRRSQHHRQSQHLRAPPPHDPAAPSPKLQKLRTVIGISTPDSLATSNSKNPFRRPAPNLGIYARVVAEERRARFQFYFAASVINACYFGQIVVAAALTALGASSASHIAITVLGATNTVIAGILTYLKGQGLPNRLRMYWNGLRKCREFIEEKEREVEAEGWDDEKEGIDVDKEIDVIVRMYHDVRQTAEDNTPDTYLPMQGNSANILARSNGANGKNAADPAHATYANPSGGSINGSIRYPEDDSDDESEGEDDHEVAVKDRRSRSAPPAGSPAVVQAAAHPTSSQTSTLGSPAQGTQGPKK